MLLYKAECSWQVLFKSCKEDLRLLKLRLHWETTHKNVLHRQKWRMLADIAWYIYKYTQNWKTCRPIRLYWAISASSDTCALRIQLSTCEIVMSLRWRCSRIGMLKYQLTHRFLQAAVAMLPRQDTHTNSERSLTGKPVQLRRPTTSLRPFQQSIPFSIKISNSTDRTNNTRCSHFH